MKLLVGTVAVLIFLIGSFAQQCGMVYGDDTTLGVSLIIIAVVLMIVFFRNNIITITKSLIPFSNGTQKHLTVESFVIGLIVLPICITFYFLGSFDILITNFLFLSNDWLITSIGTIVASSILILLPIIGLVLGILTLIQTTTRRSAISGILINSLVISFVIFQSIQEFTRAKAFYS